MTVRKIGNATIQKVEELCGPGFKPQVMFPRFDQQAFEAQRHWLYPEHVDPETHRLIGSVHSWVIRTPQHTILVDTCLGNHKQRSQPLWNNLDTPFLDRLRGIGVAPEDVDYVMCTHLHVDHVGWNTRLVDGRWVPTFPNARYLFAKEEYAHWQAEREAAGPGIVQGGAFDDSVLPVVEAGRAVMIDYDHQPDRLITLDHAPGHTPGSVVINLADGGRRAMFSGDIMHHPIQVYHPEWSSQFCWDGDMSAASRRKVLEKAAETGALLCPAHFPGANAGYIKDRAGSFAIDWDRG